MFAHRSTLESLSPTPRTAISSARHSLSRTSSWDNLLRRRKDLEDELESLKMLSSSRSSSSRFSQDSISRSKSKITPAYMSSNPFIDGISTHSFTHSRSTHSLAACPRCNAKHFDLKIDRPTIPSPKTVNRSSARTSLLGYDSDDLFAF